MTKVTTERKTVEIGTKRIPLRKLLHGKEIREAAKALEDFRLVFNEQEILYGAKLSIRMDSYGDAVLIARRLESDKEMEARLENARIAAEQKAKREKARKIKAAEEQAKKLEAERMKKALDDLLKLVNTNNLTVDEIAALIKNA